MDNFPYSSCTSTFLLNVFFNFRNWGVLTVEKNFLSPFHWKTQPRSVGGRRCSLHVVFYRKRHCGVSTLGENKPHSAESCKICSRWPCLMAAVGPDDVQRCLTASAILRVSERNICSGVSRVERLEIL